MLSLLNNKYLRILTLVLAGQAFLFYTANGSERTPLASPLTAFPVIMGDWHMVRQSPVDSETLEILKADDTMYRDYQNDNLRAQAGLFIAYFQTQRQGQSPHSPKNCLPGSGWQPEENNTSDIQVGAETIRVNHFVVSKGDQAQIVYYWYQSQGRAIAGEFAAKFYLIADSIRKHRSDTALVRITVPRPAGGNEASTAAGLDFVKTVYPAVKAFLPK
jgi:EpsI family protein